MGKLLARAMATHGKDNNGQITGAHSNSNVRQVDGVRGECDQNNNHPTMNGGFDGGGIEQQCTNQIKRTRVGGTQF